MNAAVVSPSLRDIASRLASYVNCEGFPGDQKGPFETSYGKPYAWGKHALNRPGIHDLPSVWPAVQAYHLAPLDRAAIIDVDDPDWNRDVLLPALPRLKETFADEANGKPHYFITLPHRPPKATRKLRDANHKEIASLRGHSVDGKRSYAMGPGSLRSDGTRRKVVCNNPPIALTEDEYKVLMKLFAPENSTNVENPRTAQPVTVQSGQAGDVVALAWKYIQAYLDELTGQRAGRNDFINDRTAWNIGRLSHYIGSDQQLIDLILEAAVACGYVAKDGESAARATIESGFNAGKTAPRRIEQYVRHVATAPSETFSTSAPRWRDSFQAFFYHFYARTADNVTKVARKLIEYHADGRELNPQQFAKDCKLPLPTVYRVLNKYGIGRLLFGCMSVDSQDGNSYSLHEQHSQDENTVSGSGKKLLPTDQIIENMISLVAIPRLKVEFGIDLADELMLSALGSDTASQDATAINARLETALPVQYRSAVKQLHLALADWRSRLADPNLTPLAAWETGYTKAIVAARFSAVEGKQDSWHRVEVETHIPRGTYARVEKQLEIARDPVFNLRSQEIDDPADLPALAFNEQFKGFPRRVVIWQDQQTFRELDYTNAANRQEARKALSEGLRVAIRYQQSSIPRRMTEDEKRAAAIKPEHNPRPASITAPRQQAYIGYTENEARKIAIAICDALGEIVADRDGVILPLHRLKSAELVQVMLGNGKEIGRLYTPKDELEDIALELVDTSPALHPAPEPIQHPSIKPMPPTRGYYETGFNPDVEGATTIMNAYYARMRGAENVNAATSMESKIAANGVSSQAPMTVLTGEYGDHK